MALRSRLLVLGLVIAGCGGSSEPDRFGLTTPQGKPVTAAERQVISGWSQKMHDGDVKAAAKFFSVPSQSIGMPPGGAELASARQVEEFNDSFPCGTRLLNVSRTAHSLVQAEFELTDRPGAECGTSAGRTATFAFRIDAQGHISQFVLVQTGAADLDLA